ncbi:MAG TPA: hypothetical protein VFX49_22810 [Chloroflexota bacterium]|nr:hypothetical protein [Chloroflexota bacterium]
MPASRPAEVFEKRIELPGGKLDAQIWLRLPGGEEELAAQGPVSAPQVAEAWGGGQLIVFRIDGLKAAPAPPAGHSWSREERYPAAREAGGSSIGYAFRAQDGAWRRGWVARAQEILVRDRMEQDAFDGRLHPAFEHLGAPELRTDRHGVVWCFWTNPLRRHSYVARWLGPDTGFGPPLEASRAGYGLTEHVIAAEPEPAMLSTRDRRRVLFIDLLEVADLRGIERTLECPRRLDGPLITPEQVAQWRGAEVRPLGAPRVWRDRGRLLMELGPRGPMGNGVYGRMESDDGLEWRWCEADEQGVVLDGERDEAGECRVTWLLDEDEPDEERRYKGTLIRGAWTKDPRRWLVTSPDGVRWRTEAPMEGMHHLAEHGGPSFRDPATGDYVAVGRTSSSGHRALGMLRSGDLIRWRGDEPLLDVDDPHGQPAILRRGHRVAGRILDPAGEPRSEQIYWGTVWPADGQYLCLYGRYHWDARYEACLATSRDGRVFQRPFREEVFLPTGAPGEWDSGIVFMDFGVTRPVRFPALGIERLYYAGSTWRHGADPFRMPAAVGVAELPVDRWAYLTPRRGAALPATVVTVPIAAAGEATVEVDAEGPVSVDFLDEDGQTLAAAPRVGAFRLAFRLHAPETRLYSFRFSAR